MSIFDDVRTMMDRRFPQRPRTETRGTNTPYEIIMPFNGMFILHHLTPILLNCLLVSIHPRARGKILNFHVCQIEGGITTLSTLLKVVFASI